MQSAASSSEGEEKRAKPFLKWAGGKRQLLPTLLSHLPRDFKNYIEPFIGGGAMFFAVQRQGLISDVNAELINTYKVIQHEVESLIEDLGRHVYEKEYFYSIRQQDRQECFNDRSAVERASRFIYLNRTCFNGLYRVNGKGEFNTPFGRYSNPLICDAENLRACSRALQGVKIICDSFDSALKKAASGDFVYLDPPYVPLTKTSDFTAYSKDRFGEHEQHLLAATCKELDKQGVKFLLSNSSAPLVKQLYKDFSMAEIPAVRAINSKADKRGEVLEILVKNF